MRALLPICAVLAAGCIPTLKVQPLAQLPIAPRGAVEPAQQGWRSVVVYPFEEARGAEWGRASVSSQIPVINLLHSSFRYDYPEQHAHGDAVTVGSLDTGLPSLLAGTMRRMRLTPNAVALAELSPAVGLGPDYVVTGRIRRARFETSESVLLGATLGLVGVPNRIDRFDLEYDVVLFRGGDRRTPLFRRTYRFVDLRAGGLYYHDDSRHALLVRALEQTLPRVVEDLAIAMR